LNGAKWLKHPTAIYASRSDIDFQRRRFSSNKLDHLNVLLVPLALIFYSSQHTNGIRERSTIKLKKKEISVKQDVTIWHGMALA